MNIAGCKTVNSRSEWYSASSTGRVLAWFTSASDGWYTPEKTTRRTPASCAAATIPVPSAEVSGAKAGMMRNTPSTPSSAARTLAGSRRSPTATLSAPASFAWPCFAGSCTNARTSTPLDTRAGTTSPANCPVAPVTSTRMAAPDQENGVIRPFHRSMCPPRV